MATEPSAAPSLITTPPAAPTAPAAALGASQTPPGAQTQPPAGQLPPVTAESFWRGWITDEGKINKARYDHLPEDLKGARPMLERYETPDDVLKSLVNHAKLAREKTLSPPPDNAPEADKKAFDEQYRRIFNVPQKPEDYGITKPEALPDEMWDNDYATGMAKAFHEAAIPPGAAKKLIEANNKLQEAAFAKIQQQQEAAFTQKLQAGNERLNQEFGHNRARMEQLAIQVAKQMGIDPSSELFSQNAEVIIMCARHGVAVGEDKFLSGESKGAVKGPTEEMADMMNNPNNRFYAVLRNRDAASAAHKDHALWREADRRLTELAKQAASMSKRPG